MTDPLQAGLWGALAGSALVLGSVAALTLNVPRRVVALIGLRRRHMVLANTIFLEAFDAGGDRVGLATGRDTTRAFQRPWLRSACQSGSRIDCRA